jgi:pyruvate formate-lyase/glycerol dehydratase family glycyl radical enzyme
MQKATKLENGLAMIKPPTGPLTHALLHAMALQFNHRPALRRYLRGVDGWLNFTIGFRTENGSFGAGMRFRDGRLTVCRKMPADADTTMIFADTSAIFDMLRRSPNETLNDLMRNRIRMAGNFSYLGLFNFYTSLLLSGVHRRLERRRQQRETAERRRFAAAESVKAGDARAIGNGTRLHQPKPDQGVKHLADAYLPELTLTDFPRLQGFLDVHFTKRPEICAERAKLLTDWHRANGFEVDSEGQPWIPELRQAQAFKHLMENRRPIIREGDLLAGTTTSKEIGVVIYPDAHGTMIWGELLSAPHRELNPYNVSRETIDVLHHEVFPYWAERNFREWVRQRYDNPLCQQLDERFAVYFVWKSVGISHTIPDYPKLLRLGARGMIAEVEATLLADPDPANAPARRAMILTLEGLVAYAGNLAREAERLAEKADSPQRAAELRRLAEVCRHVPEHPARSLDEAVNTVWIAWIALHNENTNTGLSLGRLDLWLQPYFEMDLDGVTDAAEKAAIVRRAVELVGCLFMRCTDHLPLIPDLGNYLFGGSSSDQAITLGGVRPDGSDAVCDMTYIFLKVTELLGIRDPNVNARYHPKVNSDAYLRRLCEVNLITSATPSMHNDEAVIASLAEFNYPPEAVRDWSATGCVEPTLSGQHMGHTGGTMMNMVAALEMALFSGLHPLMNWKVGPNTGEDFATFEAFFGAFEKQFGFLIDHAADFNYKLGEAHAALRPTPLLSALVDGCRQAGRDVVRGGATFNTAGTAIIGLADVTDSLMAIKKLVFEEQHTTLADLRRAAANNFADDAKLHALVRNKAPRFGSGDTEALAMADRVAKLAHDLYGAHRNYRGGPYTTGFWSMSNHVAFGTLAGALPSGRLAGKPFTPGLTPQPGASPNLLDNLRDVAGLTPQNLNNNMAFNVKIVPGAADSHEQTVDRMRDYVKTYFELGGMQMQMNVASSDTLRHAMLDPDAYRHLLVRISGYNAYFVTLNRDMQMELIERSEYTL